MTEVACVWPVAAALGEGPLWDPRRHCLWFVDILKGAVHRFDPKDGTGRTFPVGGMPSFIVPTSGTNLLLGNGHDLQLFDGERVIRTVERLDLPKRVRLNDATVDRSGRLWFGTMDMEEKEPLGALFCRRDGVVSNTGVRAIVTNGPAVSKDCRALYHADTVQRRILRYDITRTGALENETVFARIDESAGYPDGLTLDSDGCLWSDFGRAPAYIVTTQKAA